MPSRRKSIVMLKRQIGLYGGVSFIVGGMMGTGIFISPNGVLQGAGSVGLSICIWVICGFVSLFGALTYAELGTLIPKAGGEYAYLLDAVHPVFAFLFAFITTIVIRPATIAIVCLSGAQYLLIPVFGDDCFAVPDVMAKTFSVAVLGMIGVIHMYSVRGVNRLQILFSSSNCIALAIIIIGGVYYILKGNTVYLETGFKGTSNNVGEIVIGFYNCMFAYGGWHNLNSLVEELENPYKNLPRAIFISIPLVAGFYSLTAVAYFAVLSPEQFLDSPAVALTWIKFAIPNLSWAMPLFVALSAFGGVNAVAFASERQIFAAAREKHTIQLLSFINVKRYTPTPSVIFTILLASLYCIPSSIEGLINLYGFALWLFRALVFGVFIYLRYKRHNDPRPYKCPIIFGVLSFLISVFFVVAPVVQSPRLEFLYALLFIIGGILFYIPFVHFKKELPGIDVITAGVQLFLQVSPTEVDHLGNKLPNNKLNDAHCPVESSYL